MQYTLSNNGWDHDEIKSIHSVIQSDRYTMGEKVKKFEQEIANFHNCKHAIMLNSGSSANLVASTAITIKDQGYKGQFYKKRGTVVAPAVSWSTTYFPLVQLGYQILLIDVDETFNINIEALKSATKDEKIVGLIGVNLLGVPAENQELINFCKEKKIFFIEDNCESFGASLDDIMCGTYGDVGTLSFFYSHHLQTMEGGMMLTNCDEIANISKSIRAHGWTRDGDYSKLLDGFQHDECDELFKFVLPGYCLRPLEFSGAIGSVQLQKWNSQIERRLKNYECFKSLAVSKKYLRIQKSRGKPTWFGFGCLFNIKSREDRKNLYIFLKSKGIESRPIVAGNFAKQPVMQMLDIKVNGKLIMSDEINDKGLFFGNDGRDLSNEIKYLFEVLDIYFNK
ncbi:DegT/DnrJ/EryC1/StrS family aminotransferase [Candidatus Pelagibacter sp.]|nr:DegT/DnrJ/EryC1/StrS family aminotransferase [Candidatus Pelagibacter sp.]